MQSSPLPSVFSRLDRLAIAVVGESYNPFTRLGALAIASLIIACASGVGLLFFYDLSVQGAHESVAWMLAESRWGAGVLHSLHRYSSDLAILLAILHLLRVIANKAISGPRTLAWISGVVVFSLIGLIGWTGYWLVWDQSGFLVAQYTARIVDAMPIFGRALEPLLLLDPKASNTTFLIIFFTHMLLPLALFIGLWIHIARLNRPVFLVDRRSGLALLFLLLGVAIILPAPLGTPASAFVLVESLPLDLFFLLPVVLFDYLSLEGGAAVLGIVFGLAVALPFIEKTKQRPQAVVTPNRCIGCGNCYTDCPYEAISLLPRRDGKPFKSVALVDPDRCTSCGICNGACDSNGINLVDFSTDDVYGQIDTWAREPGVRSQVLLFVCDSMANGKLRIDAASGMMAAVPDCRVIAVPCSGHVNPSSVKRALEKGFKGVMIATSLPGACAYREGNRWVADRLECLRKPTGKLSAADRDRIAVIAYGHGDTAALVRDLRDFLSRGSA